MKKLSALFIAVLILFSFCSCSSYKTTALVISGTEIDSEIFTYYLDRVIQRPADYGLPENPQKKELKESAVNECKNYLAANTKFRDMGLTLSASEKVEISENVNNFWMRFENHYKNIGVSKQTLTKIMTSQAYTEAIFNATYDKGTGDAAAEQILQNYFYGNYISFRNVCAYFTSADGKTPMSQADKNRLIAAFEALSKESFDSADDFSAAVQNAGYSLSDSVILKKGSEGYPDGFYEKVSNQGDGTVQIIIYDECVFAVWKENLKEKGESVYAGYRSSCIKDLYSGQSEEENEGYIQSLTVEEKSGTINRIIKKLS